MKREGEKEALKAELERKMAVKLREQKEQMRSFMQVQLKQIAKMRDEAVEREKRLQKEWESKVGGEVKIGKKRKRKPGKYSAKERVEGTSSNKKKNQTKEDLEQIEKEAAAGGRKGRRTAKDLIFRTVYLNTLHQW